MKLVARALDRQVWEFTLDGACFGEISSRRDDSPDLPWIAPGLVDIQINGFAGVDFNRALESDEAWRHATGRLYAHGCTGFLIALITNSREGYQKILPALTERIRRDPRNCLGFHMEGPWLNPDPGYRGAHKEEWMQKPDAALLDEWRATAGELIRIVTLAPEVNLETSLPVIRKMTGHGIRPFIGHSGAMGEALTRAIEAGAVAWTHLGNAMPSPVPKFENVIFHALAQPTLLASLIPDGVHLPPHVLRSLVLALTATETPRLLFTTDAMAGADSSPGKSSLGEVEVQVCADGSARLPGSGRLAGSTLTPFQGIKNIVRFGGLDLPTAWAAFSTAPAKMLGLPHGLRPGASADFCLFSPNLDLLATYHQGCCVYEAK